MPARFAGTLGLLVAVEIATAGWAGSAVAAARGVIETPSYGSTQTGVALISGWSCTGRKIQLRIDDGPPQTAGAHTSREDTRAVCGRADTGFALLINFNLLPPGRHRVAAYADGVEFALQDFETILVARPLLSPRFPLLNTPRVGLATIVAWDFELRNFRVDAVTDAPPIAGDYYGATTLGPECAIPVRAQHATFTVTYDQGLTGVTIRYPDGKTIAFPPAPAALQEDGFVKVDYPEWTFRIDGRTLRGGIRRPVDSPCSPTTQAVAAK